MASACPQRSTSAFGSFLIGMGLGIALLQSGVAAAQECPYGYPVDCGTYCCESGGVCYNGGCNAPQGNDGGGGGDSGGTCPAGYPVDCGSYCCEGGGVCYNGGCNAPGGNEGGGSEGGTCPAGYPVDCGSYCCESGGVCYDGGCNGAGGGGGETQGGTCPDGYPVDCGTFCCSSGASCGSDQTCLAGSGGDSGGSYESCPAGYPVDCGNDYCCPSGSSCTVGGCVDSGGTTVTGTDLVCSSQAIGTDFGSCSLDFCIADAGGSCSSYYLVNGGRIECSGCAADQYCIQQAAEACTGSGVSMSSSGSMSSGTGGGCCDDYNSCDWSNDGACDCGGAFSSTWDYDDCAAAEADESPEICSVSDAGAQRGRGWLSLVLAALGLCLSRRRLRG